eukprot:3689711-Amphidinium_carterae.1
MHSDKCFRATHKVKDMSNKPNDKNHGGLYKSKSESNSYHTRQVHYRTKTVSDDDSDWITSSCRFRKVSIHTTMA